ncbi:hypothetical protein MJO28_016252 [Puccinia striiformis f. sp. tritici]|uniref:Uncharacterized protein n=1 Tax=Puccinia striiformis f. sp. tritici TaxID=168172 RepID=A0ACC0DNM2_9BASI|nr:hypothetical protein MJO28_016252 [Puccinia striiformis f. sp. tritici]
MTPFNFIKHSRTLTLVDFFHTDSLHHNERARHTGALWDLLSEAEQAQWKDQVYTLYLLCQVVFQGMRMTNCLLPPKGLFLGIDSRSLRNLSTSHQLEGYLVLPSRNPWRPVLHTVGSIMADGFLYIHTDNTDQTTSFLGFVTGKQAVRDVLGLWPVPARTTKQHGGIQGNNPDCAHCLGRLALFFTYFAVNDHLTTAAEFCKRPLDMRIEQSRWVLTALANGWFKLTGPPAPDDTVVGANDLTNQHDNSLDDGDTPGGDLAVTSRPKKHLPRKKATAQSKKPPAAPKKVPSNKSPAAPKQAPIKPAQKRKTALNVRCRRQSTTESPAVSSSSSDEGESLVGQLARESSSSDGSSIPSVPVPSRAHSDSDGSSLPSVSFSESASDISKESPPRRQPQQPEGRAQQSWTPVPCPEPWGTWHYCWPYELKLVDRVLGMMIGLIHKWRNALRGSTAWGSIMDNERWSLRMTKRSVNMTGQGAQEETQSGEHTFKDDQEICQYDRTRGTRRDTKRSDKHTTLKMNETEKPSGPLRMTKRSVNMTGQGAQEETQSGKHTYGEV